jgi:DNA-binding MarR family transcriptional regulator
MTTPASAVAGTATDMARIEQSLTRITYLASGLRQHDRLMAMAGMSLDRAAVALLRQVEDSEALRLGELAAQLGVEASHVTRQVQQLERAGYLTRVPDPADRRAQRVRVTPAGEAVILRIRETSCHGMQLVMADWSALDLHRIATLFRRMVGEFLAGVDAEIAEMPCTN